MRLLEFAFAFCTVPVAFAPAVSATSIPITGAAERGLFGGGWGIFELSGPNFYATSHGQNNHFIAWCGEGICAISAGVMPAIDVPLPGIPDYGWSMGSLNGRDANFLRGELVFPDSARVPPLPTATVTALGLYPFYGDLKGFFAGPDGVEREVFDVYVAGKARLQMSTDGSLAPPASFLYARYELTGTATPTPEPGTVFCLGIALAVIALWKRPTR